MTAWSLAALVLMGGGMLPAVVLAGRGTTADRLVGMQLAAATGVAVMLCISVDTSNGMYLIVPMVLAVLSFTGSLVYFRQVAPRR